MKANRYLLLVDDNPRDTELTVAALDVHGLRREVVAVQDGDEALSFLRGSGPGREGRHGMPALILLDLKMPRIDGFSVLDGLKTDSRLKHIPVVLLTSSCEERDVVRGYALGANAYIVKPVTFRHLVETLKTVTDFWLRINELPAVGSDLPGTSNRGKP